MGLKIDNGTLERYRNVLLGEKNSIDTLIKVLKSDIYNLLNNYLEMEKSDLSVSVSLGEDGFYMVNIAARASRITDIGGTLD